MSDSPELLKPNTEVTDSKLQIEIGKLKADNERLQADYATLLESSTVVTNKLREEVREVRSQLETECADRKDIEDEFWDMEEALKQTRSENSELAKTCDELRSELTDLKQKSAPEHSTTQRPTCLID